MNISKEKENDKNQKKETSGKNPKFYIALLVCLSAVSAAGWSTYKTVKNFITPPTPQSNTATSSRSSRPKGESKTKEVSSKNTILDSNKSEDVSENQKSTIPYEKSTKPVEMLHETTDDETTEPEEKVQAVWAEKPESISISYPGTSTVTKEFSDNAPMYSKTLGDWRCHEGTDFKADTGSSVKAITSGVVTDIYEDPSYGITVVVSHDAQFTAYYSGLNEDVLVKKGNRIKSGEDIGNIGTVPCEILEEPHLHLSINKDGKFIDPLLVLDKETQ